MKSYWLNGRKVVDGDCWNGLRIYSGRGPLMESYLDDIRVLIKHMNDIHPRLLAFRVDLRVPEGFSESQEGLMSRFFASFIAKIKALELRQARNKRRVRHTEVGYVWAKEKNNSMNFHYHVAIFLNRDAFHVLGNYVISDKVISRVNENTYQRLVSAWASALGIPVWATKGLVEIPRNPVYYLCEGTTSYKLDFEELFYRLSYLAKVDTKVMGRGSRNFGRSRVEWLDESDDGKSGVFNF